MNVHWKYDILFSFAITYDGILNPDDFLILPSPACRARLKKHNLIFRNTNNGAHIIAEKRIHEDASLEPVWPIRELTGFTFLLQLRRLSLFPFLSPYSPAPGAVLPELYGLKRIFYFDNLNADNIPDQGLIPSPDPFMEGLDLASLPISDNGSVSEQDFASVVPNKFSYQRKPGVTKIELDPFQPGETSIIEHNLTDEKPRVELNLNQSAYEFIQTGSGSPAEILYAGSELLNQDIFGVIQIYKNESVDYNLAIRYTIHFEEP